MSAVSEGAKVPINDTLRFVQRWLRPPPSRLLEIGAGAGELTGTLRALGYDVTAIDSDATAVAAAAAQGIHVRLANWPTAVGTGFDAVLLVRTLHHLIDPNEGLARVRTALMPQGLVLVEDFAFADMPATTSRWLHPWVSRASAANVLGPVLHPIVGALLGDESRSEVPAEHHDIHSAGAMERALHDHFKVLEAASVPYLYRYLASSVRAGEEAVALVCDALVSEGMSIVAGELAPLGRRWVAQAQ